MPTGATTLTGAKTLTDVTMLEALPLLERWATPPFVFLAGALLVLVLPGILRAAAAILVPLAALVLLWNAPASDDLFVELSNFQLSLARIDGLSRPFGLVFCLAAAIAGLYAWTMRSRLQQVATLLYAGSALGAVFAGDLVTLFVWWEGTALASVFLIWARATPAAYAAGMRYLVWQVSSGVALFAGTAIHIQLTGSTAFETLALGTLEATPGAWIILFAIAIKAGFPLLNGWLGDAYPAGTITGTVVMSIFTTKMAVYALARGFAGTDWLVWVGAAMALTPIVLALLEDDLRRILAYALNSQLGFMVVGIGIGTPHSIDGAVAHAMCSVLYQSLLFMGTGAVMLRAGTPRASALLPAGGAVPSVARAMPLTFALVVVGAASISSVPGLSGFVSKSVIVDEAAKAGLTFVWIALIAGAVGAVLHTGLRLPMALLTRGGELREAPVSMLLAMGVAAAASVVIGVAPGLLYGLLPFPLDYAPYTVSHFVSQFQLLLFAVLGFAIAVAFGWIGAFRRATTLDGDWLFRGVVGPAFAFTGETIGVIYGEAARGASRALGASQRALLHLYGPQSRAGGVLATGNMALWIAILLGAALIANLLEIR